MKNIVILGAGFGGLAAAKDLCKKHSKLPYRVTIVDQKNHHLFQPLLYQVATAGLSPADIAVPIRSILQARSHNVDVTMDRVSDIDRQKKIVSFESGRQISYDFLVVACGATHSYFGHNAWQEHAPGLKTLEQATEIRRRILNAFEKAESTTDEALRREYLTFVIVGGGPTGVELAGAIGEISRKTLEKDFSRIDPSSTRIILIEAGPRILNSFSESLSRRAARDLEKMGVTVWTATKVTNIHEQGVDLGSESLNSRTVIWAAGVKPSPLAQKISTNLDKLGRVIVEPTLLVKGSREVYVIGDMVHFEDLKYGVLPGQAPVAMQQGRWVARNILLQLNNQSAKPFRYVDKGQMATIGRRKAVAEFKGIKMVGLIAWLAWLLVHIYYLVGFQRKLFVFLQWIASYVFFKRGARLITAKDWKMEE